MKAGAGVPLVYETLNAGDIRAQVERVASDATFRANAEKLELSKFCPRCRKHQNHKETK